MMVADHSRATEIANRWQRFYKKKRSELAESAKNFGSLWAPEGDYYIERSEHGPGGDSKGLYVNLQQSSRELRIAFDHTTFFNTFIYRVMLRMYYRQYWHQITARTKGRYKEHNTTSSKANNKVATHHTKGTGSGEGNNERVGVEQVGKHVGEEAAVDRHIPCVALETSHL
ncbi:hypothetical protein Y032_0359g3429 [Ancylostoma ceylanicum]|uniref:Uncharacterized protein n=1 Tax=Ancylostoma ceylanicum TaxID=53326 RepID=A0A016RVX5_9BILA|nr:hypothetical protein Y032_0359g3429 [Ancylostoma ceylanicum]